ncbi:MAG: hypothetical protein ACK5XN_24495, partial [Bacteroidota bacterium]
VDNHVFYAPETYLGNNNLTQIQPLLDSISVNDKVFYTNSKEKLIFNGTTLTQDKYLKSFNINFPTNDKVALVAYKLVQEVPVNNLEDALNVNLSSSLSGNTTKNYTLYLYVENPLKNEKIFPIVFHNFVNLDESLNQDKITNFYINSKNPKINLFGKNKEANILTINGIQYNLDYYNINSSLIHIIPNGNTTNEYYLCANNTGSNIVVIDPSNEDKLIISPFLKNGVNTYYNFINYFPKTSLNSILNSNGSLSVGTINSPTLLQDPQITKVRVLYPSIDPKTNLRFNQTKDSVLMLFDTLIQMNLTNKVNVTKIGLTNQYLTTSFMNALKSRNFTLSVNDQNAISLDDSNTKTILSSIKISPNSERLILDAINVNQNTYFQITEKSGLNLNVWQEGIFGSSNYDSKNLFIIPNYYKSLNNLDSNFNLNDPNSIYFGYDNGLNLCIFGSTISTFKPIS